jgi:tetratricopeptide (TPR) repeat protein
MLQENLQLSYQLGSDDHTATILFNLGRVALASQRIEQAIEYIQKAIHLECEAFESPYLAMYRLYLGKCFAARPDRPAARAQFRQVVQDGHALDKFHLVCWGLVGIARIYIEEGQIEKALEIALLIRDCPTEYQRIEEDRVRLLAELQAVLPEDQLEAALQPAGGELTPEQARAAVLAYVRESVIK